MDINFGVKVGACLFLSVVFIIGLVGNAFVCSMVYAVRSMRTATNFILVNLAVADIIACLLSIPIMITTFVMDRINYHTIKDVSKVHFVLTIGAGTPLVFCHLLLCVDRYDSVIHPFNRRITKRRMKRISMVIWITAATFSLLSTFVVIFAPMQWFLDEQIDEHHNLTLSKAFDGVALTVILLTLFCMLQSFVSLRRALNRHSHNVGRSLGRTTLEKEMQLSSAAVILVSSFALTSLPWLIARFLHFTTTHQNMETFVLCYSMMHTSHAINPLVYAGYMRNFRRAIKARIQVWLGDQPFTCCRGTQVHPGMPAGQGMNTAGTGWTT